MAKYIVTSDKLEAQEHEDKEKANLDYSYRRVFDTSAKINEIVEVQGEENGKTTEENSN